MRTYTIFTLILIIPATISKSAKPNARPVHEVINEQARIDEKVKHTTPGILPYGNPLAGNNFQNARLHAQNQQAMFNAERVRQHRAQVQRWTKAPIQMDSYMKAYHDSQESHQLALEQQQAKLRDSKVLATTPKSRRQEKRGEGKRIRLHSPEPTKITKADAIIKERSRNHRSHGSLDYYQHLHPKRYQTVYLSPGPTYDQGVTIKPNGNVGLKHYKAAHETKLYTEAIPSTERPIYPKQYHQMQEYHSAQDIDALKSLLKSNSKDQLSGLNALIVSGNQNKEEEEKQKHLETPIDLYFYLKDAPTPSLAQQYDHTKYAQIPHYASAYMPEPIVKDHTPITEQVDDVEDPNKHPRVPLRVQPVGTPAPAETENIDTTTTKSNNYYKVEVASQTISSGLKTPYREPDYYVNEDPAKPSYQALQYAQPQYPPSQYGSYSLDDESDQSERYLHHNAQPTGVQHLTEDGTGVSAYGDDSVSNIHRRKLPSKSLRIRRATLETAPFLLPNNTNSSVTSEAPKAESLIRLNPIGRHRFNDMSTFLITPKFPIGEATDLMYDEYEDNTRQHHPNRQNQRDYDEDYEYSDDFEYDYDHTGKESLYGLPAQSYAPSAGYNTYNTNPNKYRKRFPESQFNNVPETSYGTPLSYDTSSSYGPPTYGPPTNYGPPTSYGAPQQSFSLSNVHGHKQQVSEPLYVLSQTQLKNLIGHHNLNIQHLDIFQTATPKIKRKRPSGHRKYKRRYPSSHRQSKIKKNLHKIHKITGH